jgi:hypothetical protein
MSKIAVTLDDQELTQLQMILADQDGAEALRFLREVVWERIQAIRRKELRSHLEQGQR